MHKPDHFNLLCDFSELADLLAERSNIERFLDRTVRMVARHLKADVCSIYLYDESNRELVLRSTVGLNPKAVGRVRMKPDEGLVGSAFQEMTSIREACASLSPRFKYFVEADEDRFESFLAVPIQRGVQRIGVLVVQHERRSYFTEVDAQALRAVASQLAGAIENARLLTTPWGDAAGIASAGRSSPDGLQFFKGQSAAEGFAHAPATVFFRDRKGLWTDSPNSGEAGQTLDDFRRAVAAAADQLKAFGERLAERLPESASLIFTAHFMILKDPQFIGRIESAIEEGTPPAGAVRSVARDYIDRFAASSHVYIREKVHDIEDLASRILKNLRDGGDAEARANDGAGVVIARDLYPSELLKLAADGVAGIILVRGGVTSHVAILARSLHIPLVIADQPELLDLPDGTPVIMDADIGNIYIRPTAEVIRTFEGRRAVDETAAPYAGTVAPVTRTADGVRVRLLANINLLSELPAARTLNAEGIGLYRTEFPFLIRPTFPSEAEQVVIYQRVVEEMDGREVTIRTLDVGGEKALAYADTPVGPNPELGLRSIRFSLRHREIFEGQIRAILRAAAGKSSVRIMFPMISSVDEFRRAKAVVVECGAALEREGVSVTRAPAVGIMVELPAAVGVIDELAGEADFLSVGTNDFVQYMLGVDRTNEQVAEYYCPHHPAVLRGLAAISAAARRADREIAVCGEMAHEPAYLPFLLGIGIRKFSVDPNHLPAVQALIAGLSIADAEAHARDLLAEGTVAGTTRLISARP